MISPRLSKKCNHEALAQTIWHRWTEPIRWAGRQANFLCMSSIQQTETSRLSIWWKRYAKSEVKAKEVLSRSTMRKPTSRESSIVAKWAKREKAVKKSTEMILKESWQLSLTCWTRADTSPNKSHAQISKVKNQNLRFCHLYSSWTSGTSKQVNKRNEFNQIN